MRNTILASRYARALYSLAKEQNEQELIFDQMRFIEDAFRSDSTISEFINSPLVRPEDKVKCFDGALKKFALNQALHHFLLLLARKNRLPLFIDVVASYQSIADEMHGVTRGVVRSATVLGPDERKRIEELVSKATKKQVILTYKEDPSLLGGLVAEVGSFTFDDSLTSHLNRINEQLTRSVH